MISPLVFLSSTAVVVALFLVCDTKSVKPIKPIRQTDIYPSPSPPNFRCPSTCRFKFCEPNVDFLLMSVAGSPLSPAICRHRFSPILASRTGEAYFTTETGRRVPISQLTNSSIRNSYFPSVLAPDALRFYPTTYSGQPASAIGHKALTRVQRAILQDLCLTIPVLQYQFRPDLSSPYQSPRRHYRTDCVTIMPLRAKLDIRLSWNTRDDFDLEVMEPHGNLLLYNHRHTQTGMFVRDDNNAPCAENSNRGMEVVAYRSGDDFVMGDYVIRVRRFTACTEDPVPFTLSVSLNGKKWVTVNSAARNGTTIDIIYDALVRLRFAEDKEPTYFVGEDALDGKF